MLERLLDRSLYEFPSFEVALFSLLLAFVLATAVAFTYKITYRGISYSGNFFHAMVLSAIATTTVIMAVGDNVAVGFGIIGAIAIIRFRTRINEPRNIIFIFASIGVGIACGVYGYAIGIAGTIIFCGVVVMLHFASQSRPDLFLYSLNFSLDTEEIPRQVLEALENNCQNFHLMSIGNKTEFVRFEYQITLKDDVDQRQLYKNIASIEGLTDVRLSRKNNSERL
jgi:uncharacterized membrane protein YhiD involved in acid resistance